MLGVHSRTMRRNKTYLVNYSDLTVIYLLCLRVKVVPSEKRDPRILLIIINYY